MSDLYLILTAIVILGSLLRSYRRTGDPLSPLFAFAPMLFYVYVYHPYVVIAGGELSRIFPKIETQDLEYVLLVNLVSLVAFCTGASSHRRSAGDDRRFQILDQDVSSQSRQRFFNLSVILGTMAGVSFWYLAFQSGGPVKLWNDNKPHFSGASGYIGEMPMLTYPAILLLAAAWQGRRLSLGRLLFALGIASPQISWAILGKRRGTIFLIAAALAAFWYLVKNKRPNWKIVIGGVGMLGLFLLFVAANRSSGAVFNLGGESQSRLGMTLTGNNLSVGDEFVSSVALVLTSDYHSHHYWGKRFLVMFCVRPIPSFLWPSKWKDVGLAGLQTEPGLGGMGPSLWSEAVGSVPAGGTAGGFVGDAFLEWGWGGVLACYGLGFGFSWLWKRWASRQGVWTLIYIEAMILSIFLPSQSLGAWAYRFALLAVPTAIVFRFLKPQRTTRLATSNQPPIPMQTF